MTEKPPVLIAIAFPSIKSFEDRQISLARTGDESDEW